MSIVAPVILNSQTGNHTSGVSRSLYIPEERNTSIKIGDREVKISILQYGSKKDILYINLHDNETTSFLAAKSVLEEQGGTLINIENNDQRVIRFRLNGIKYGFDPNRIYSGTGIGQTLRDNRRYS